MAESNELNFGNLENSNDVIENNLDDVTQNQDEKENKIKGLSNEEYNDPNQIRVTLANPKVPIVVLFGPPACGKTMTLVRLARYLNKQGYKISPVRTFRPNNDLNYVELCDNFSQMINSADAANSTANVSFMLVEVINKDGKCLCQILEAPGEYYFNPNNPNAAFPSYVNTIIACNNRKLWAIMVEPDWQNTEDRINYVARINDLSRQMASKDKTLFIFNKIDKTNFTRKRGQINITEARVQTSYLYPGIFEMFKNQNPITRFFSGYQCRFVPFQTGTFTETTKRDRNGNSVQNYQEGPDDYPRMLWNEIQKSIVG